VAIFFLYSGSISRNANSFCAQTETFQASCLYDLTQYQHRLSN